MVREKKRKGQAVDTSETSKGQVLLALRTLVIRPLSTKLIEWLPYWTPTEAYPLGAPRSTSIKADVYISSTSPPKSATRQPTGTQGESRSIRGIGVPPPTVGSPAQWAVWGLITQF